MLYKSTISIAYFLNYKEQKKIQSKKGFSTTDNLNY